MTVPTDNGNENRRNAMTRIILIGKWMIKQNEVKDFVVVSK